MSERSREELAQILEDAAPSVYGYALRDDMAAAAAEIRRLSARCAALEQAQALVNTQAEDEGLWFVAVTISEGYLQQELRRLHAAIEGALSTPSEEPR